MFRLIYITGKRKGRRLTIRGSSVIVGTSNRCGIRTDNAGLQPEHAIIEERDRGVFIRDLTDSETVQINGVSAKNAILHDGDLISIGSIRMKFQASRNSSALTGKRRRHCIQHITLLSVILIIALETAFIVGWNILPFRIASALTAPKKPAVAATPKPPAVPNEVEHKRSATFTNDTKIPILETNITEIVDAEHTETADSLAREKLINAIEITTGRQKPVPNALKNLHRLLLNIQSKIRESEEEQEKINSHEII